QSMACIHCGVCVSACLSLEVDPDFIGPAALAKAYRFVGDPRDAHTEDRLLDLAEDPHGIYDCTHCFACVEVCPKDVAPMDQIRRIYDEVESKDERLELNLYIIGDEDTQEGEAAGAGGGAEEGAMAEGGQES